MHEIKKAFDLIKADELLKENTLTFLVRKQNRHAYVYLRAAGAFAALIFVLWGGYYFCFTPVSAITVEGENTVALSLNRMDRVIAAEGMEAANTFFAPYEEAVKEFLLTEDGEVSVSVTCQNEEKKQSLSGNLNALCNRYRGGETVEEPPVVQEETEVSSVPDTPEEEPTSSGKGKQHQYGKNK